MRVPRRWAAALSAAAVFIAGEVAVRTIDDRLRAPPGWQSVEADVKVRQMEALGDVDIALVGSSVVAGGADPAILAPRLGRSVYNAALSAGFVPVTSRWAALAVRPILEPDVIVHGLISFDLHDHPSHAVFEDALVSSPAGSRAGKAEGVVERIDRALGERSALWRHRRALRRPSTVLEAIEGDVDGPKPEWGALGPSGRVRYEDVERAPGEAAGGGLPLQAWRVDQRPLRRIRELIRSARSAGTEIVLVAMPVSQTYVDRHPRGETDQRRYHHVLRRLAEDAGVPLLDLDTMRDPSWFLDQVHLGETGTRRFSEQLAVALAEVLGGP